MEQEQVWIQQALRGDKEAFACLVEVYQTPVYNLAYRMLGNAQEAEDAAQEAFIRAYTRLSTYNPKRKFASWLLSITSHYCIDRLRRWRFNPVSLDELPPRREIHAKQPLPEERVIDHQQQDAVQALLDTLPAHYRAPVILRYWYDFSYREIAEVMNLTESAVKSRLHRARAMLAQAANQSSDRSILTDALQAAAGK